MSISKVKDSPLHRWHEWVDALQGADDADIRLRGLAVEDVAIVLEDAKDIAEAALGREGTLAELAAIARLILERERELRRVEAGEP
jgi:hypothetical protein